MRSTQTDHSYASQYTICLCLISPRQRAPFCEIMVKSALANVAEVYGQLPFPCLVIGHSLYVAALFRRAHQDRFLLNYWIAFMAAFGGGTITALLIQDPSRAANSLFTNNMLGILWTVAWWGINYFPKDLVFKLQSILPLRVSCRACVGILRSGLIVHRVSAAVALYPGVLAAPLVLGTLAGCAGKLMVDALHYSAGISKGPSEISSPGFSTWSAFLATLATYVLVHVTQVLNEQEALALVTSVLVAHGVTSELTGQPLDFTQPFATLFHTVTLIPMPTSQLLTKSQVNGTGKSKRQPSKPATPVPSASKQSAKQEEVRGQSVVGVAATPGRTTRRTRATALVAGN